MGPHDEPSASRSPDLDRELTEDEKRGLAPPDYRDPVIEHYKKGVDLTLLLENLKLSHEERAAKFVSFMRFLEEIRKAGQDTGKNGEQ